MNLQLLALSCCFTLFLSCSENRSVELQQATKDTAKQVELPALPASVVLKNWEPGDPQLAASIAGLYQAWDSDIPTDMASYLADSTVFDWPNGVRVSTNKETVEA